MSSLALGMCGPPNIPQRFINVDINRKGIKSKSTKWLESYWTNVEDNYGVQAFLQSHFMQHPNDSDAEHAWGKQLITELF